MNLIKFGKYRKNSFNTILSMVSIISIALTSCSSNTNLHPKSSAISNNNHYNSIQCSGKKSLKAEGSTVQHSAIAEFNNIWMQICFDKNLAYNPTGSGAGVNQFIAKQVDFAGSDTVLQDVQSSKVFTRCGGNQAWHIPLVFSAIALSYNIEGVNNLVLNPEILAKIFQGQIKNWDDPSIVALNSSIKLPSIEIKPIYRSDSSGTTSSFQQYLMNAAPYVWTKNFSKDFQGGTGEGAQKSSGVIQAIKVTPGSIGYVEKGITTTSNLPNARLDSGLGAVELNDESTSKAANMAKFKEDSRGILLNLNDLYSSKRSNSYPLITVTYEIVCSKGYDIDTASAIKSFLLVASNQGQYHISCAGYISLPDNLKKRLLILIEAITY